MGRAGNRCKFLDEAKLYVAWDLVTLDLNSITEHQAVIQAMEQCHPMRSPRLY
jgi:hypothetical protein